MVSLPARVRACNDRASVLNLGFAPGDELVITRDGKPVAKLTGAGGKPAPRRLGTLKGTVVYMAPDFDAPLDDFKEYME